ncbi:MAG: hypothetical protein LBP23_04240 [Treponema sp.]|nr:hypothetical protein [Treponema sp.]
MVFSERVRTTNSQASIPGVCRRHYPEGGGKKSGAVLNGIGSLAGMVFRGLMRHVIGLHSLRLHPAQPPQYDGQDRYGERGPSGGA